MAKILTRRQELVLKLIAATQIAKEFYFSGGTALAHYYLQHRKSEDLDFFKNKDFEVQEITTIIKSLQPKIGFVDFDFQNSFNRNLYFLRFDKESVLKLEFTYYPFDQIEQPALKNGLLVDSIVDIATNKLFTIVQKPRGRDYYDLFEIIKKKGFAVEKLRMLAKQKFDWHIDPLQLASRLNEIDKHLDDPILMKGEDRKGLVSFFEKQALDLQNQIISG